MVDKIELEVTGKEKFWPHVIMRKPQYKGYGITDECAALTFRIYEAHEYAHAASRAVADRRLDDAQRYMESLSSELRGIGFPPEQLSDITETIQEANRLINSGNLTAVVPLGNFLDMTKEMMFKSAVDCECGKVK